MDITVGTAGHIDHGKSSLVRALSGMDTDRLKEEKERGLSIELGFAYMDRGVDSDLRIFIVDVPGHERFIRTMLAGTTGIDMVLFTVAADDGVMPQTVEHLDIIRMLGLTKAVFVITKIDRVDNDRALEVKGSVQSLLTGTPLEDSPFVLASALTGEGVDVVAEVLERECRTVSRPYRGPFFRLPVDRAFNVKGYGMVVTGTVASGSIKTTDTPSLFDPARNISYRVRVRGIESAHNEVAVVETGARAALNISAPRMGLTRRGPLVSDSGLADFVSKSLMLRPAGAQRLQIDCRLEFSSSFESAKGVFRYKFFHLTGESLASVRLVKSEGGSPFASFGRLTLSRPLLVMRGDRFILRDSATNKTIGGGEVLFSYFNPALSQRVSQTDYAKLARASIDGILDYLLAQKEVGFLIEGLDYILNLTREDIISSVEGKYVAAGGLLLSVERLAIVTAEVLRALESFHATNASCAGLNESELPVLLKGKVTTRFTGPILFKVVLDLMVADGLCLRDASLIRLANHTSRLIGREREIQSAILALFATDIKGITYNDIRALPFETADIETVLRYLLKDGAVVRIKQGKFLSARALELALETLYTYFDGDTDKSIIASQYRDLLGTGRKLAIEILEYLDSRNITLRSGDKRRLRSRNNERQERR